MTDSSSCSSSHSDCNSTLAQNSSDEDQPPESESDEDCDGIQPITHTVVFKCIGAVRDRRSQEVLKECAGVLTTGVDIPVRVIPEPSNAYDAKAICFQCNLHGKWERIGYVVREALESMHTAISCDSILAVNFDWVKYIVYFRNTPGWYAGIRIKRKGSWPDVVVKSSSKTFN